MSPATESSGLHRFAVFTAVATLVLISVGGLVTSHGAGMAVPDWPNTYGYNLFFFPFSAWIGGVFYEHSHRLAGAAVGLLTVILAAWLHGHRSRRILRRAGAVLLPLGAAVAVIFPGRWQDAVILGAAGAVALGASFVWPRCEPQARWLRRLGLLALGLVIFQGVLGGLRVTLYKDELGIVHATLAQLFFVLIGALALFTSRWWRELSKHPPTAPRSGLGQLGRAEGITPGLHRIYGGVTLLVLAQLILGATMRHEHAGLAVPDFPLAYGKLWPATDADAVAGYNRARLETRALNDLTATHIHVHMAHRLTAVGIFIAVGVCWWFTRGRVPRGHPLRRLAAFWFGLVWIQFGLGAWTVWSNKAADIATLHVVTGAVTLLTGALLTLIAHRCASLPESTTVMNLSPRPATI